MTSITKEKPEELTNQEVYDILCRWQGLRVFQLLYLDETLSQCYARFRFDKSYDDSMDAIATAIERMSRCATEPLVVNQRRRFSQEQ